MPPSGVAPADGRSMRTWSLVVGCSALLVLGAGCAPPETPEEWTAERRSDSDATTDLTRRLCDDVEAVALGSLAHHIELDPLLDGLASIAARTGAADALPQIEQLRATDSEGPVTHGPADAGERWSVLATTLDAATADHCEIPVFTAMYVATHWSSCHGEVDVPVARLVPPAPDDRRCSADGSPGWLPCFGDAREGYLPVDCTTGDVLIVTGSDWVPTSGSDQAHSDQAR